MTELKKQQLIAAIVTAVETVIGSEEMGIEQEQPTEMLTIREAAQTIKGLSEHTVRQLVAQGKVPSIRTGAGKNGKILVPKNELVKYLTGAQARTSKHKNTAEKEKHTKRGIIMLKFFRTIYLFCENTS